MLLSLVLAVGLSVGCSRGSDGGTSSGGDSGQAGLPPDPGPAGLATLAGVDSNSNAVRDDIERYIAMTYPANTDAGTRGALTQYALAIQASLLNAQDATASVTNANTRIRALECLMFQRPTDANAVFAELRAQFLNTDDRSQAYLLADSQIALSTLSTLPSTAWASACTTS